MNTLAKFRLSLPVTIHKEKGRYVAYTPALDLSTSGKNFEDAKKRFGEAVRIFMEELESMGTLDEVLTDLGWTKVRKEWQPPVVVYQEVEKIKVPAMAYA